MRLGEILAEAMERVDGKYFERKVEKFKEIDELMKVAKDSKLPKKVRLFAIGEVRKLLEEGIHIFRRGLRECDACQTGILSKDWKDL